MITKVVPLLLALVGTHAVDRSIYQNCSGIPVCSENRYLERQERYQLVIPGSSFAQGVASFTLRDLEVADLVVQLNISAIEDGTFRVQIEEAGSPRYHIPYVLDGEPQLVEFDDVVLSLDSATLQVGGSRVIVGGSPLSIQFYQNDVLQVVIDTDRLTLRFDDLNTPFTLGVRFPQASHLYGLHEHADHIFLRNTSGEEPYRVKTIDINYYELYSTMAMYGAVPVVYGHGVSSSSGIFLHNAAEQWVETTINEAFFMVDSGALDVFVFLGPSIEEVVSHYTAITGRAHLPPLWALGYHQCRWGYADQEDVQTVIATLDQYDFPVDVIWLDIQHTDDYKFFTWNRGNFSTPLEMLANLSSTDRYLVTLSDPHFKAEQGYFVYDAIMERDLAVKNLDGSIFYDECWPGNSTWMDFLNPQAREYYSSLYSYESWSGTTSTLGGIWNDMNEAAIFNDPNEKTFPLDVVHYGGVSNRDIHNMYGFLQTLATHEGLLNRDSGALRPFILTRAHFAGSQRYAAFWTGDNQAEWGYIKAAIQMCLNSNLVGIVFCGCDVGGFFGEPTPELLERFYQAGAWLPFFREHSNLGSERREPYLYDEDVQGIIRGAIKQRYAHLPVWYTVFYEHTRTGSPVITPLWYHYPDDDATFEIDDQLLLGSDVLVKVVDEEAADSVQVYFPGGADLKWYSAQLDGVSYSGTGWTDVPVTIDHIPVFYRQGAVIPLKLTSRPSTTAMWDDYYTLYVFLDEQSYATGRLYLDDYKSFEYRDSKRYFYVSLTSDGQSFRISTIESADISGFTLGFEEIITIGPDAKSKTIYNCTADGTLLSHLKFTGIEPVTIKLY